MRTPRPRIKDPHRPVRLSADHIRVGGVVPGITVDIVDADGWVWTLLERLDGSMTVDQVTAHVAAVTGRPKQDVLAAIDDLTRAGYIEDASEPPPAELTDVEQQRYSAGQALLSWMDGSPRQARWEAQLLLRQARVTVVGIGGVGSTAAMALAMSGVGHLHCVDPDVVELSNLNRQVLFAEPDLGRPKVEVAVQRLRIHNSTIRITGERRRIDGPASLRALATDVDVLLVAADTPSQIRSWANQACWKTGTAWVHGGYSGPLIGIGWYRPGAGPCFDCLRAAEHASDPHRPAPIARAPATDRVNGHAANAITAGITGHFGAHAVISLITDIPALPTNRQLRLNLVTLTTFHLGTTAPHPKCATCGPLADASV